jgi:sortase B
MRPENPPEAAVESAAEATQNTPPQKDSIGETIRKIIFTVSLTAFVVASVIFISTLLQSNRAVQDEIINQSFAETSVQTTINDAGEIVIIPPTERQRQDHNLDLNEHYLAVTDNYAGYLWADGCSISDPVVQGTDNEYYLTNTYYDAQNKAGAIFMDYRVVIEDDYTSPNVVIYGHNQEDGTMFGDLKLYKNNPEFYKDNAFIRFNTRYNDIGDYVVFGFFVTNALESQDSDGEVFRYHDYIEQLGNESTFNWYLGEIAKRNEILTPVDVTFGDKILTLSTCSTEFSNSRFVVFARKLRPDETADSFDLSATVLNTNAARLDWDAITSGMATATVTEPATETAETAFMITRPRSTEAPATTVPEIKTEPAVTTVPEIESDPTVTTVPETQAETESATVTAQTTPTEIETAAPETDSAGTDSETYMIMTR